VIWQDVVIFATVFTFTLTTVPMILSGITPPLLTSIPMVAGSVVLGLVYLSLSLPLSMGVEGLSVTLWSLLLRRGLR
jgi:hypothetical protein